MDSCPSHDDVGGFFFEFEAVRTDLTEMLRAGKPNCLVVVLVRAKKLKRLEKYAETPGTTDPTCLLTLDGEKKRSRTVENQLNPHGLSAC